MTTTKQQHTQTTRINGKRVRIVTKNGKVTTSAALPLESDLQAAQVRALRAMPEYVATAKDAAQAARTGKPAFTFAADQNAARRGPKARSEALRTGMVAGEHDLRIYMAGGRLGLIENKVGNPETGSGGKLSPAQKLRHALLEALGFDRQAVIRAVTEEEAAAQAVTTVRRWLADNDNEKYAKTA
ncbi:VRR-NUC domain-containing protein [Nitratireductor kimnyeongensis]|uniref:VRR-NUC domain-containing protein n=1 Tax=Nitratireductor kimnyeongensis TaxID=430679 RepID=A0ABW0T4Z9_9HYPH|nr:VRR-NUC domain-containing protein [Nitratireductor kimnyeongensis]QZZ34561.1 VRR-NUC domain-containing protein [Nitratireductor kimnyeongensis]